MPIFDVRAKLTIDAEDRAQAIAFAEVLLAMAKESAEVHEVVVYRNTVEWGEA